MTYTNELGAPEPKNPVYFRSLSDFESHLKKGNYVPHIANTGHYYHIVLGRHQSAVIDMRGQPALEYPLHVRAGSIYGKGFGQKLAVQPGCDVGEVPTPKYGSGSSQLNGGKSNTGHRSPIGAALYLEYHDVLSFEGSDVDCAGANTDCIIFGPYDKSAEGNSYARLYAGMYFYKSRFGGWTGITNELFGDQLHADFLHQADSGEKDFALWSKAKFKYVDFRGNQQGIAMRPAWGRRPAPHKGGDFEMISCSSYPDPEYFRYKKDNPLGKKGELIPAATVGLNVIENDPSKKRVVEDYWYSSSHSDKQGWKNSPCFAWEKHNDYRFGVGAGNPKVQKGATYLETDTPKEFAPRNTIGKFYQADQIEEPVIDEPEAPPVIEPPADTPEDTPILAEMMHMEATFAVNDEISEVLDRVLPNMTGLTAEQVTVRFKRLEGIK